MEQTKKPNATSNWIDQNGNPVSCQEKLKMLNENLEEIRDMLNEALEDAILMGCDKQHSIMLLKNTIQTFETTNTREEVTT